ncbi:MBL fold metallo-hydrolase [Alteromonas macleodii]|jgi:glyoxylase-like metal-dependent hydrolase (beta-lactamase superfamily II)|uniref:MBL fold metallo-hydrolase n=1 Tax=Alteromonas TaxID=226 RepID=UPI000EE74A7C|nr:MBL fold metallo-hydrolase [Alteromonas sp. MmMcT2-2]MEC9333881.1 MBL fold metallo-hydrolase [Pseudomonadota bacterium]NKX22382.1 MBL fold metallo-hydrolase [Alteromonadaceae bacterium A_SAG2]HAD91657.1 MBL fold metallo-hydrolase [Alteromonas macleodii]MCG7642831.1 MBL fold metallo-hydrolase [Alteromonas sp. MmMcT2-2]MED5489412.1 MBL fold metallo-hydrolase [Pseudomonadota bacterium]|tara:strand:+ start:112 stop:1002 length:891 start_codon:yes stop_codon:yes gene_type:complete
MKTAPRFSAHILAAFIAASPLVYSTINPANAQDRFADVEVKATAIKGSVHMLTGAGGNIGVSAGEDGVLIIDDQFAPLAEKIAAQLGELGSDKPKYVINTHYHGDHTGSNAFFHSHKGATILAHENVRVRLANDEKIKPEALPTITYEDGIKIYFNGETLHVMHLAVGHTDGDSVVWFEQPNVMHTGDLFFNGRFPYIDQGAGGNVEGYMDSVKQLLAKIDDETVIIPGHGDISNKQEYSAFLAMISETFSYVKALKQDGKTLDEVKSMGLDDKWADWSWNFINEEKWITTLYTDA